MTKRFDRVQKQTSPGNWATGNPHSAAGRASPVLTDALAAAEDSCNTALTAIDRDMTAIESLTDLIERYHELLSASRDGKCSAHVTAPARDCAAAVTALEQRYSAGQVPDSTHETNAWNGQTAEAAARPAAPDPIPDIGSRPASEMDDTTLLGIAARQLAISLRIGLSPSTRHISQATSDDLAQATYQFAKVRSSLTSIEQHIQNLRAAICAERRLIARITGAGIPETLMTDFACMLRNCVADDVDDHSAGVTATSTNRSNTGR